MSIQSTAKVLQKFFIYCLRMFRRVHNSPFASDDKACKHSFNLSSTSLLITSTFTFVYERGMQVSVCENSNCNGSLI